MNRHNDQEQRLINAEIFYLDQSCNEGRKHQDKDFATQERICNRRIESEPRDYNPSELLYEHACIHRCQWIAIHAAKSHRFVHADLMYSELLAFSFALINEQILQKDNYITRDNKKLLFVTVVIKNNFKRMEQRVLYVLQLQKAKYYVGVTNNLQRRLQDHKTLQGSEWTKKYRFVKLLSYESLISDYQEDMKVKELMGIHGIQNVRGGKYSYLQLSAEECKLLEAEITHAKGLCFKCKQPGHTSKSCTQMTSKKTVCDRCGRNHLRENCFAHETKDGQKLCRGINKNGLHCAHKVSDCYDFCYTHKN